MDAELRNGIGFLCLAALAGIAAVVADGDAASTLRVVALLMAAGGVLFVLKHVLAR